MFVLPGSLNHLFPLPLKKVKNVGVMLSKSANHLHSKNNGQPCSYLELLNLFDNQLFGEFFIFNYDQIVKLTRIQNLMEIKLDGLMNSEGEKKQEIEVTSIILEHLNKRISKLEHKAHIRLMNPDYCKRKIVRLVMNEMLYESQKGKLIGENGIYYAPNILVNFRKLQKEYNAELLASRGIEINGDIKSLATFAINANRKISELYARVKGFEHIARERGMNWAFITVTAPGEYHPNPRSNRTSSWNKKNTKAAHQYLMSCWRAFGKAFAKKGHSMTDSRFFGLRVTEPHKDGCPHWHMLCFYHPDLKDMLFKEKNGLFYSNFAHSKNAIDIEYEKTESSDGQRIASAASYCFKYISKALSGDLEEIKTRNIEQDVESTSNSIERIEAWRAATGIRAYQTFGVTSLSTVWNSMRKVSSSTGQLQSTCDEKQLKRFYIQQTPFCLEQIKMELESLISTTENNALSLSQFDALEDELKDYLALKHDMTVRDALSNAEAFSAPNNHIDEEIAMTLTLNDFSNGFNEALEKHQHFMQVMSHAVEGDWGAFYECYQRLSKSNGFSPVELIKKKYQNCYGETQTKVIGVNTGFRAYLFKQYEIVKINKRINLVTD
ncbi:replication endonuclease [Vibrio parahaemolyticus]|uniref:replication endonuclease n=1 Tax=Vibrio parahaemolyticus TaxID=670 RepID=UPI00234A70E9|nr:replication endonuclease [Vibrio parahaemolyticus]WCM64909.1 replication endonuclease [Vibrio parahaemolyticus]